MKRTRLFYILSVILAAAAAGCGDGGGGGREDADAGDLRDTDASEAAEDIQPDGDAVPDHVEDTGPDPVEAADPGPEEREDIVEDTPVDVEEEEGSGIVDELGTDNQDITGVERVIFLGDSITATPYLTPPWSERIQDDLRDLFGSELEMHNYAQGGARTEHVQDEQLPRIDTSSPKRTLVMMTIGGNDALQVIGEPVDVSLDHLAGKVAILREIVDWIYSPGNFSGGVYLIFTSVYDPTDGEGDFTHCGIGVFYEDWPEVAEIEPVANTWFLAIAMDYGADMLDMHGLFAGHGFNSDDPSNPYYCSGCEPDCPCPRWFDFTCIHPNSEGHEALAGFFMQMITR